MMKPILAPINPPRSRSVVSSQLLEWIFSFLQAGLVLGDDMEVPFLDSHSVEIIGYLVCCDQRGCKIVHAFHGFTPGIFLKNQEIVLVRTALQIKVFRE